MKKIIIIEKINLKLYIPTALLWFSINFIGEFLNFNKNDFEWDQIIYIWMIYMLFLVIFLILFYKSLNIKNKFKKDIFAIINWIIYPLLASIIYSIFFINHM